MITRVALHRKVQIAKGGKMLREEMTRFGRRTLVADKDEGYISPLNHFRVFTSL